MGDRVVRGCCYTAAAAAAAAADATAAAAAAAGGKGGAGVLGWCWWYARACVGSWGPKREGVDASAGVPRSPERRHSAPASTAAAKARAARLFPADAFTPEWLERPVVSSCAAPGGRDPSVSMHERIEIRNPDSKSAQRTHTSSLPPPPPPPPLAPLPASPAYHQVASTLWLTAASTTRCHSDMTCARPESPKAVPLSSHSLSTSSMTLAAWRKGSGAGARTPEPARAAMVVHFWRAEACSRWRCLVARGSGAVSGTKREATRKAQPAAEIANEMRGEMRAGSRGGEGRGTGWGGEGGRQGRRGKGGTRGGVERGSSAGQAQGQYGPGDAMVTRRSDARVTQG